MNLLKRKPIVYEGELAEQYKRTRRKWVRLFIVGTILPFVLPLIISSIIDTVEWLELIDDGEIILTSFTVTLSLVFDMYSIKEQRKVDETLDNVFAGAIILLAVQLVVYSSIKASNSATRVYKSLFWSVALIFFTYRHCDASIDAMFSYSNDQKEGGDND